jgi:hypothetical protein
VPRATRPAVGALALATLAVGCGGTPDTPPTRAETPVRFTVGDTAGTSPDTTLSARTAPRPLAIVLPAPTGTPLGPRAQALADRAVFVPRTTRWFVARRTDAGTLAADIGRMDEAVATGDSLALAAMLAASSPVPPGLRVIVHGAGDARATTIDRLAVQGRRIVALIDGDSAATTWRLVAVVTDTTSAAAPPAARCTPGDTIAIAATIERLLAGTRRTDRRTAADSAAPRDSGAAATARGSALVGCFGAFRALAVRRPAVATPDVAEKAWLVRADGRTRLVRLRDLSYPLHDLLAAVDTDGDGTDELLVRSHRPAMETIAALRMTDSVTFTRFVNGFTVERR